MRTIYSRSGNTIDLDVAITNIDDEPVNLAGAGLEFNAVSVFSSDYIRKTIDDGIIVTDYMNGLATITIDPEDTDSYVGPQNLFWDLVLDDPMGGIRTVASGKIALSEPEEDLIV